MAMEYRRLPHGVQGEAFSALGLGLGGIQNAPEDEIERVIIKAIDNGINYFDLCAGGASVYAPFGRAIKGRREKVFFQLHLGAVYNEKGEYGWSRDLDTIKKTLAWELEAIGINRVDMGFLHCVDASDDFEALVGNGVFDYLKELKAQGTVDYIGFSSHTPHVAEAIIDTGIIDMMMFSINPAYDMEKGDDYGVGSVGERARLFRRCEAEGIGISVMKPFFAGKLLDAEASPFGRALTKNQLIKYALDRPAVLSVLPGVRGLADLDAVLAYVHASEAEKDYSVIGELAPESALGNCVYCNHCQPCPVGIDVGLVTKYYDLARAGDDMAKNHYAKLSKNASDCADCGHCDARCPFKVEQSARMREISRFFGK